MLLSVSRLNYLPWRVVVSWRRTILCAPTPGFSPTWIGTPITQTFLSPGGPPVIKQQRFLSSQYTYVLYSSGPDVWKSSQYKGHYKPQVSFALSSVADPGCLSRIPIFTHPRFRIPEPGSNNNNNQGRRGKICCLTFFCSHKFAKLFYFWTDTQKNVSQSAKNYSVFLPKILPLSFQKYK